MPKKKKTRYQKINADNRRKSYTPPAIPATHTYKPTSTDHVTPGEPILSKQNDAVATSGYSYLVSDLVKTVSLTTGIIIAEYILYIVFF